MEVDLIFKIAGVGIVVAIINQLLGKSGRDEQALMVTLAGLVIVLFMVLDLITDLFSTVKTMFDF